MTSNAPVVFLNRDAILNALDVETEDVFVPEWGGTVRVRSVSAAERERLMKNSVVVEGRGKKAVSKFDMPTFRVKLATIAMVDEEGNRLFSESDVAAMGKRNAKALQRVAEVAARLAGIEDDTESENEDDDDDEELTVEGKDSMSQGTDSALY